MSRRRRARKDIVQEVKWYAKKGVFTPQELANFLKVTPNRSRQILEGHQGFPKLGLVILGKRKSSRGKPANLWGYPGTKITGRDVAARPRPSTEAKKSLLTQFLETIILPALEKGAVFTDSNGTRWSVKARRKRAGRARVTKVPSNVIPIQRKNALDPDKATALKKLRGSRKTVSAKAKLVGVSWHTAKAHG